MKFQPIGRRVLVRRHVADDKTPGGIIVPDNSKEVLARGDVVAVPASSELPASFAEGLAAVLSAAPMRDGKTITREQAEAIAEFLRAAFGSIRPALPVAVGDVVLFGKYTGAEVTIDGEALLALHVEDVIAVAPGGAVS